MIPVSLWDKIEFMNVNVFSMMMMCCCTTRIPGVALFIC